MSNQKMIFAFAMFFVSYSCSTGITNQSSIKSSIHKKSNDVKSDLPKKVSKEDSCLQTFKTIKNKKLKYHLKKEVCLKVSRPLRKCKSNKGHKLFHYDKISKSSKAQKILVFSTLHGDESEGSVVASYWINRLEKINSRNSWRILPVMNPDGALQNTRTNSNGVDLNRNFPTNDWGNLAHSYWERKTKSSPRRFPGESAGSEPETKCAIDHIKEFNPDFVIAIHTPYGLLDFDGPNLKLPFFSDLRWHRLGTFPGSLGRYMWKDRNTPVLTVELRANDKMLNLPDKIDSLQDLSGKLALLVKKTFKKELEW